MIGIGRLLGHSPLRCVAAMAAGGRALKRFVAKSEDVGKRILDSLHPEERVFCAHHPRLWD